MASIDLTNFIEQQRLPSSYLTVVDNWFAPVADDIVTHQKKENGPLVVGINGTQGSGKSTLAALLVELFKQRFSVSAIALSIDDFYLTKSQRQDLAQAVHPLFITRGVPGTHDVEMACDVISSLKQLKQTTVPRFDKASDDRYGTDAWETITAPVDIIIVEGWCMGAEPQSERDLNATVNAFETDNDADAIWRSYSNNQLKQYYPALFNLIDKWIMLKAPSFDCVYQWRMEQEHKLRKTLIDPQQSMSDDEVLTFIQHYQRITEYLFATLPDKVDYLFELNTERDITKLTRKEVE